jgi:hypothetical protein
MKSRACVWLRLNTIALTCLLAACAVPLARRGILAKDALKGTDVVTLVEVDQLNPLLGKLRSSLRRHKIESGLSCNLMVCVVLVQVRDLEAARSVLAQDPELEHLLRGVDPLLVPRPPKVRK